LQLVILLVGAGMVRLAGQQGAPPGQFVPAHGRVAVNGPTFLAKGPGEKAGWSELVVEGGARTVFPR